MVRLVSRSVTGHCCGTRCNVKVCRYEDIFANVNQASAETAFV
jgi:hypothetical protein